ncbi:hypothetical protein HPB47_017459 [Ixodes persulcatus]|uniref:Uncharacterized protein n=1 Tax=Ixodes persulcatus TaxID=34615 RepID=A0AC60QN84_IXOPE|nr:hypothetical protein HPB47_017459 [Ixodes persulcatus]
MLRLRLRVLGYFVRKKVPHGAIKQVTGFQSSNLQANHRFMQIARDEISSEIRVMQELLPTVMSEHQGPNYNRQPSFKFLQESARTLLSDSWDHFHRNQKKSIEVTPRVKPEPPLNLSGVQLSPSTESLLAHGPKFAPAVANTRVDQLAAVYEIAARIPEDTRQDFVAAGSRAVCFHGGTRKTKNAATPAIKELQSAELRVLQADKTGRFVILNKKQMQEKTDEALKKNFLPLKSRPSGSLRSKEGPSHEGQPTRVEDVPIVLFTVPEAFLCTESGCKAAYSSAAWTSFCGHVPRLITTLQRHRCDEYTQAFASLKGLDDLRKRHRRETAKATRAGHLPLSSGDVSAEGTSDTTNPEPPRVLPPEEPEQDDSPVSQPALEGAGDDFLLRDEPLVPPNEETIFPLGDDVLSLPSPTGEVSEAASQAPVETRREASLPETVTSAASCSDTTQDAPAHPVASAPRQAPPVDPSPVEAILEEETQVAARTVKLSDLTKLDGPRRPINPEDSRPIREALSEEQEADRSANNRRPLILVRHIIGRGGGSLPREREPAADEPSLDHITGTRWQRLDALKTFVYPTLYYLMQTGTVGKTQWTRLDESLHPLIKRTPYLLKGAFNDYLYGNSRAGVCGSLVAQMAPGNLLDIVKVRVRRDYNLPGAKLYLSGYTEGEFRLQATRLRSVWAGARKASARLSVAWELGLQGEASITAGSQVIQNGRSKAVVVGPLDSLDPDNDRFVKKLVSGSCLRRMREMTTSETIRAGRDIYTVQIIGPTR